MISVSNTHTTSRGLYVSESCELFQYNLACSIAAMRMERWELYHLHHNHSQKRVYVPRRRRKLPYIPEVDDVAIPRLYSGYKPLTQQDLDGVEAFVFFVGWQRSGHSIIGSLLDSHPDVMIAHEFFLFSHLHDLLYRNNSRTIIFNRLAANSFQDSRFGARSHYHNEKGYNLRVPNSWQGRFRTLKVIGDKTAGDVTAKYAENSTLFGQYMKHLKDVVRVTVKVINVVRNPFDMIATLALYRGSSIRNMKFDATVNNKFDDLQLLRQVTKFVLGKARSIQEMEGKNYDWELMRMYSEDFIRDPRATMTDLCTFLGLDCEEDYLQQCVEKTFKSTSKSRYLVKWDSDTVAEVEETIKKIPFLRRYSYNDH